MYIQAVLWHRDTQAFEIEGRIRAKAFKASVIDLEMKTHSLVFLHCPFSQSKIGKTLLTGSSS